MEGEKGCADKEVIHRVNTNAFYRGEDEEHEKETDEKRTGIAKSHRFESFAPQREGNDIKWYVDGRDYFWVSSGLETYHIRTDQSTGSFSGTGQSQGEHLHRRLVAITRIGKYRSILLKTFPRELTAIVPSTATIFQPRMAPGPNLKAKSRRRR